MSESQKSAFIHALANFNANAIDANENLAGKALPCHVVAVNGPIVTVQFDILPSGASLPQVTIPIQTCEYIRPPIQIGCKGVTMPISVSMRGVSGLGIGMADMSRPASLAALMFVPVANIGWAAVDPDVLTLYGPKGVEVRTQDGSTVLTVKPGEIRMKADVIRLEGNTVLAGALSQEVGAGGSTASLIGPLDVKEGATVKGIQVETHTHEVNAVKSGDDSVESEGPQ
ncbi:phage baseplate protein [Serratia fonticola]|uniref:phage baseplate protein n=1 Tax=Serratia fonticola TaxID=47917 RepID=UPI00301CF879